MAIHTADTDTNSIACKNSDMNNNIFWLLNVFIEPAVYSLDVNLDQGYTEFDSVPERMDTCAVVAA